MDEIWRKKLNLLHTAFGTTEATQGVRQTIDRILVALAIAVQALLQTVELRLGCRLAGNWSLGRVARRTRRGLQNNHVRNINDSTNWEYVKTRKERTLVGETEGNAVGLDVGKVGDIVGPLLVAVGGVGEFVGVAVAIWNMSYAAAPPHVCVADPGQVKLHASDGPDNVTNVTLFVIRHIIPPCRANTPALFNNA